MSTVSAAFRMSVAAALACVSLAALPSPVAAQSPAQIEASLKSYFEGKRITLRMDMPGSADGVDIRLEPATGINMSEYRNDLRRYGTAIAAGESSTVTLIKLKGDLIEFHIGGGGFGTFGDDTSTSSGIKLVDKSELEKTLEKQVRDETDRDRRRSLQRDLDEARDRRERENRRLQAQIDRIEEQKRQRIAEQRLRGGSRFNLRYKSRVPQSLRPEDVVSALVEYVDFKNQSGNQTANQPGGFSPAFGSAPDLNLLRKGMSRADAERAFGRPFDASERRAGGIVTTTLVFDLEAQKISAEFVENVLVRYTVTSK